MLRFRDFASGTARSEGLLTRLFDFETSYLQGTRQSTHDQVPITKQREFFQIIPSLGEQKRIIGALDGLFENGQRLETLYALKQAALAALKKPLLHHEQTA